MNITSSDIISSFSKHPLYNRMPKNFTIADGNYFCPKIEYVQDVIYPAFKIWLISCGLDKWDYKWDCDNFADAFKLFSCAYHRLEMDDGIVGIGIGVINYRSRGGMTSQTNLKKPKGRHAANIIYSEALQLDENGQEKFGFDMYFLEPQTGDIYDLTPEEFKSISTVYI